MLKNYQMNVEFKIAFHYPSSLHHTNNSLDLLSPGDESPIAQRLLLLEQRSETFSVCAKKYQATVFSPSLPSHFFFLTDPSIYEPGHSYSLDT